MLNKVSLTLLLALCCSFVFSQTKNIAIVPSGKKGDKLTYEFVQTKTRIANDTLKSENELKFDIMVSVLDATDEGWEFLWELDFTKTLLTEVENGGILEAFNNIKFRYNTDASGAFGEILNVEDVQAQINSLYSEVKNLMVDKPNPDKSFSRISVFFQEFLSPKVWGMFFKSINAFHFPYSLGELTSDTLSYNSELEMNGYKVPAVHKVIASEGAATAEIKVEHFIYLDDGIMDRSAKAMMEEKLEAAEMEEYEKERLHKSINEYFQENSSSMDSESEVRIDHTSGWPLTVAIIEKSELHSKAGIDVELRKIMIERSN